MKTSRLYHQLHDLLGQSMEWADRRHLPTLLWMVIGIVCSECISEPVVEGVCPYSCSASPKPSTAISRWLHNPRINVQRLYSPMIQNALVKWNASVITVIEDTSQLWGEYCLIRLSVQDRGRAVPLVWRVIRHKSSSVSFSTYQAMLKRAARLIPAGVSVCLLADRGFADTALMRYLRDELDWHFRIRVKSNSWIHRVGKGWTQLNSYHLTLGEVVLLHSVTLTKTHPLNGLHLALARDPLSRQLWMVVSDQPTTLQTFP